MTIYLRTDCGGQWGMGHAMRLHTLAGALHAAAPAVPLVFVTTTAALRDVVGPDGAAWRTHVYATDYGALGAMTLRAQPGDVLVLDQPQAQERDAAGLHLHDTFRVVRIDAPWATPETCDLLVLPGLHHSFETVEALDAQFGERLLVGAEYVLLRPEVTQGAAPWPVASTFLLVSAGGSDPEADVPLLFEMTRRLADTCPEVFRVYAMGALAAPWSVQRPDAHAWITGFDLDYVRHAGLVLTLWGATVYEALACGTPTVTLARTAREAADAQRLQDASAGAVQSWGLLTDVMREDLCARLTALWHDVAQRTAMHHASAGLLDGGGAGRVAAAVLGLAGRGS